MQVHSVQINKIKTNFLRKVVSIYIKMVRNYKKTAGPQWTEDDMKKAIDDVVNAKFTVYAASRGTTYLERHYEGM